MPQRLAYVTLLVRDYDEAIAYYVGRLGFTLVEDSPRGPGKRWVTVAPAGETNGAAKDHATATGAGFVLAKAATAEQRARVGDSTGGRVAFFLHTDDFWRDYAAYVAAGVAFIEQPRRESYATVAVFVDLYGNRWDLLGPPTHADAAGSECPMGPTPEPDSIA